MKLDVKSILTYASLIVFIGLSFFDLKTTLEVQFIQSIIQMVFGFFLGVQIGKNIKEEEGGDK